MESAVGIMELDNERIYSNNKLESNQAEDINKIDEVLSEKELSQEILRMRTNMKRSVANGSDADDERKAYCRCFVQYIAENVNIVEEKINIGCKSILLYPQAVIDTLGNPSGNSLMDSDEDSRKAAFLGIFGTFFYPNSNTKVRFLDFIDFGSIQMPTTIPRIKVWKGKIIKVFCDIYMGTDVKYGPYPIRDMSESCYAIHTNKALEDIITESNLQQSIENAIGDLVGNKVKKLIKTSFVDIMKDEDTKFCKKTEDLVIHIVHAFLSEQCCSQDTLKISSSEHCGSHDTLKGNTF
ncbi:hypothetical protein ACQ4PT_005460 [Festuca glaucescens]